MPPLPSLLTHNFEPARGPFRNLCDLQPGQAGRLLAGLRPGQRAGERGHYMAKRRTVEAWLYRETCRKLGAPPLRHPIYFFLGRRDDCLDSLRPASFLLPVSAVSNLAVTFTYGDSLTCGWQALTSADDGGSDRDERRVLTLMELESVIAREGLPEDRVAASPGSLRPFVEVQLWDDRPLRHDF